MTLTGTLRVPLPSDEAFRLFTARGERDWVDGWEPHFPDPVDDDATVGTVFETGTGGHHATESAIAGFLHRRSRGADR